jgi:serine protease
MYLKTVLRLGLVLAFGFVAPSLSPLAQPAAAQDPIPSVRPAGRGSEARPTDQIIIQYNPAAGIQGRSAASRPERMATLSQASGVDLVYARDMSGGAHVLRLPAALPEVKVRQLANKLMTLPEVEYAEPDSIMQIAQVGVAPNDPLYPNQWHYFDPNGINLPGAWGTTTGANNVVVAVIDTGILFNHPDLVGRTLPGYDLVSDAFSANDGDGRDADATDPGDWVVAGECDPDSSDENSSWHGTHVAGTIGAASDNGVGVAGVNWVSPIVPVRVLGKCGGNLSDTADGIRWAAGLTVSGVPDNANPADVLNLSLGGPGACGATYQNAIDDALGAGTVVVVAAGNQNDDASNYRPANCDGVITVGATDQNGDRSLWANPDAPGSNFGPSVEISAPGTTILSTFNAGATTSTVHNYANAVGTSMATPHVAGVVSLLLSVRPNLTPDQVLVGIQTNASSFPGGSTCDTSNCGAGIVNAERTVRDIYVDWAYNGTELGFSTMPFDTVGEANDIAWNGARLLVDAGSYPESLTFSTRLTVLAQGGTVIIGQ